MSREKKIKEMRDFMLKKSNSANVEPVFTTSDGKEIVLGQDLTKLLNDVLEQAFIPFLAEALYNAGYRKQSENVIELPCKVGDTVYCIEHKTIHECIVKMVKSLTYENETKFFVEAECEIVSPFYSDGRKIKHGLMAVWEIEWGSWYRAFRTREKAEEALAKMKGGAE